MQAAWKDTHVAVEDVSDMVGLRFPVTGAILQQMPGGQGPRRTGLKPFLRGQGVPVRSRPLLLLAGIKPSPARLSGV